MRALILALTLAAGPSWAERYALLVGVNATPAAPQVPPLLGPENDVALMAETLNDLWKGELALHVLTGSDATRAAILDTLDAFAKKAVPGDEITVYLAGHGTQIPSTTEDDGRDEVFLPSDFRAHGAGNRLEIENHIVDDELGMAFDRIVSAGARLWLIADLCHAGTLERGGGDVRARFALLGLLPGMTLVDLNPAMQPRAVGQSDTLDGPRSAGGFVGFYAAGPSTQSLEMPLDGARVHGLFTYELAGAIRAGETDRFDTLAAEVTRRFRGWGQGLPLPVFAGALRSPLVPKAVETALSARVIGGALVLDRGRIDGVVAGDIFGLSDPDSGAVLAYAQVASAELTQSTLGLVENEPDHPARISRAELIGRAPHLVVNRVARDGIAPFRVALPDAPPELTGPIAAALQAARALRPVVAVASGAPADLRLVLEEDRLVFQPPHAAPSGAFALPRESGTPDQITGAIVQIVKAETVLRIAAELDPPHVQAQLTVVPCAPGAKPVVTIVRPVMARVIVHDCDQITLDLTNLSGDALDISPLYIGPQGRIYYLRGYPDGALFGLRLGPGQARSVTYTEDLSNAPTGDMHLAVFAMPGDPNTAYPRDLRDLQGDLPNPDAFRAVLPKSEKTGAIVIPLRTTR